ncbi:MAG: glycosyltransferase family 2 protein [Cyclobacteriaceae bacterium]
MSSNLKISIVTPSFNQGQFLEQTIDSVLSQNYSNLEYIIIDGGSTDNSVEIIKRYEKHLAYWVSEKDRGQSHAINKGLQLVTGDIFNWLNSDDYYEPDALSIVNENFQDIKTSCFCGRSNLIYPKEKTVQSNGTDVFDGNLAKTIGWARIDQPETFFRSTAVRKMGGLNQNLQFIMDKEWWIRYLFLFGLQGIKKTDDKIVNFRLHENSKTTTSARGFLNETLQLFAELASSSNLTSAHDLLSSLASDEPNCKIYLGKWDNDILSSAIQYTLLYYADYFYYNSQKEISLKCLSLIDRSFIKSDLELYKKLKFRNKLPSALTSFLRKNG